MLENPTTDESACNDSLETMNILIEYTTAFRMYVDLLGKVRQISRNSQYVRKHTNGMKFTSKENESEY